MAIGTRGAATAPWTILVSTRNWMSGAAAQAADAAVKAITLARYSGSVPNRRDR